MRNLGLKWNEEQQNIFGVLNGIGVKAGSEDRKRASEMPEVVAFRKAMNSATIEVGVGIEEAERPARWKEYKMSRLRALLRTYGEAAEAMLRAADDEVSRGQG
jgi:hypothetical protein